MRASFSKFLIGGMCVAIALVPLGAAASPTDGTIDAAQKYAWGENIGWINFGASGGNVHVADSGLSGYAWSELHGWINLSTSGAAVTNNGEGVLGGNAWSERLGWISFSGVTINTGGIFSGYATIQTDNSRISFNCSNTNTCGSSDFKVATDWRPVSARSSSGGGGSGGGVVLTPTPTPVPDSSASAQAKAIDIIRDGIVDILDFNAMMVNWGGTCGDIADMNEDCAVDVFDFNMLLVYWGVTYAL